MNHQRWGKRLLLLFFVLGLLGLVGPTALWAQSAAGLPELHPISLVFTPASPVDPTTTTLVVATAQVVNTGNAGAGPFRVKFSFCRQSQVSFCTDNNYSDFGTPSSVSGLGVGGQAGVSGVLNLATQGLGFGLLRIRVQVDPDDQVAELDENNNELTALLTIGSGTASSGLSALAVDNRRVLPAPNAVYVGTAGGTVSAFALDSCSEQGCTDLIWQFNEPQGAIRAIVIDNNRGNASSHDIYLASEDGTIYALSADPAPRSNPPQPTVRWRFTPSSRSPVPFLSLALSRGPVGSDPLLIYAGSQDGLIYALRPDGSTRWTFSNKRLSTSQDRAINALATDRNLQQLYAGTADGLIYAIKPDSDSFGQIQASWNSFDQNSQVLFGAINLLAIDDFTSKTFVYAGSDDQSVYSLFAGSGQLNWQFDTEGNTPRDQTGGAVKALGVDLKTTGGLYLGTANNLVYGLPFKDNSSTPVSARTPPIAQLCLSAKGPIKAITVDPSPPAKFGAIALVASQDGNLYVLQTEVSGQTLVGCTQRTTLSSTSRQNLNSSPISLGRSLAAAPVIVTLTDTQLRAILFGANSAVRVEVRYESQP